MFFQKYLGEFFTVLVGAFGGWFFQRKRKKAEVDAAKADNQQKIMDLYQEALDDLEKRYEKRFEFLKREYEQRFEPLKTQIESLQAEIKKLEKVVETWKKKYQSLKKQFEEYKENHV